MMKTSKLRVVLDTNVMLVSLPPLSPYRLIFDKLIEGRYELFISNEILTEHVEMVGSALLHPPYILTSLRSPSFVTHLSRRATSFRSAFCQAKQGLCRQVRSQVFDDSTELAEV